MGVGQSLKAGRFERKVSLTGMTSVNRTVVLSAVVHLSLLLALVAVVNRAPAVAPYRLPGTARGVHLLTYYSAGAVAPAQGTGPLLPLPKHIVGRRPIPAASAPIPVTVESQSEKGTGAAAVSGFGNGEITMALQKVFPPPHPDLGTIALGHHGEVVLNAVIDDQGKIVHLTLLKGITPSINDTVIATVQSWSYTPATRNGTPVVSEQELHFYYERV